MALLDFAGTGGYGRFDFDQCRDAGQPLSPDYGEPRRCLSRHARRSRAKVG